jgi:tRNA-2-methylthio-N6-dimethylallyladenosine synthase
LRRHLHLPVQSGSTRVLEAMRRRYTRESYLDLVAGIRDRLPDVALSTDMIIGFPGESEEDFEETMSLTREARYHACPRSIRPGLNTLAEQRLPTTERRGEDAADRTAQALQREIQRR